jgi:3-phenylpropionate/trans-cinnamate dioxygenase ferredoxin reductase subunit
MSPARSAAVVVVGGGLAAARSCQELRAAGFAGALTMLAGESRAPYDRPPLSKPTGSGELAVEVGAELADLDVDVRLNSPAVALRTADGIRIETAAGDVFEAGAVVVATGADPLLPTGWHTWSTGGSLDSVLTLRTLDDRWALDARLAQPGVGAVTVAGGSWLGMEIATLAKQRVERVRLVEQAAWLLPLLPPEVGRAVGEWLPAAGIGLDLGVAITGVADVGGRLEVAAGGDTWRTDVLVAAVGVRPATGWLAGSGVRLSPRTGAVKVNPKLAASVPGVFAVGDVAERWSPRYSCWLPGGHWQDALDAPVVVAKSVHEWLSRPVAGAGPSADGFNRSRNAAGGYDAVPYFWSVVLGHTLQWTGFLDNYRVAQMIVRGEPSGPQWTMCWLDEDDGLAAVLACDRPRDAVGARKLQAADPTGSPRMSPARLADPEVALRDAAIGGGR